MATQSDDRQNPGLHTNEREQWDYNRVANALAETWGDDAQVWHTGGGCMNPVIVLRRNAEGDATRYVMFSMDWGEGFDSSLSVYDESHFDGDEPLISWTEWHDYQAETWDHFPESAADLKTLVENVLSTLDFRASLVDG